MSRLIYANFRRLRRDRTFWIATAMMLFFGIGTSLNYFKNAYRYFEPVTLDRFFFSFVVVIGVVIAGFSSMYVGTEYSDGIIRNKIVIGHTRKNIYLSNFLVCTLAGLLSNLAYIIVVCIVGIPIFGFFKTPLLEVFVLFIDSLLLIVVYAAIFNLIAMLISNKAQATIISMLTIFALMIAAVVVLGMLQAPEFVDDVNVVIGGQPVIDTVPNPRYLTGIARDVFQVIEDILPTGQGLQIAARNVPNPGLMAINSVIIAILTNLIGVFCFSRKDLK